MDEKVIKNLISDGLKGILGSWKVKLSSKKFFAYIIANVMLIFLIFVVKPDSETVVGLMKVINIGYWATEGGLDAIRAFENIMERRNGSPKEVPKADS